jgi:hypothetical protein
MKSSKVQLPGKCFLGRLVFISVLFFTSTFSLAESNTSFTKAGSKWHGGSYGFATIGIEDVNSRLNMLMLKPVFRIFPTDHFFLGPKIDWTGMFAEGDNIHQIGIGGELGFAKPANDAIPYFRIGLQFEVVSGNGSSENGFAVPVAAGFIFKRYDILAIQVEPGFQYISVDNTSMNIISFSIGVCGIGENVAVSVIQSISQLF